MRVDLVLRFVYVLIAPVFLIAFAVIVPMTGVLISVGIATLVALLGSERWRARTSQIPVIGRFLANTANLGDYYRARPPRPLVFYVLYPLLLPYVLANRDARRELLLYRKLNVLAVLLIPALAAAEYLGNWEGIPFRVFARDEVAAIILQLLVTFALIMPIVTTIVTFHARGLRKSLVTLLAIAGLFSIGMTQLMRHQGRPNGFVMSRVRYRYAHDPARSTETMRHAIDAAAKAFAAGADRNAATAAARHELEALWHADEARAFALLRTDDGTLALYAAFRSRSPKPWLVRTADGRELTKLEALPSDLRKRIERPN